MKISALQFDIRWNDPVKNHNLIESYIEKTLTESDVIVLPEMFSTGFSMKPEKVAQKMDESITLRWMIDCAKKYKKAIVGSVAINDNGRYFNRLFFVKDSGEYDYIDKRHLFRMAGEDEVYSAGVNRKIIEYKGVRFLPLVCYDVRFPVWSRMVGLEYDVILYVASWPDVRIYAWDTLLKARAIENLSYVVGVNRVGDDRANHYNGHSVILDYKGRELATATEDTEEAITVEISTDRLKTAREAFPAYLDNDGFEIKI